MYFNALQFAYQKHKGQTRNDGLTPYIVHPIKVANAFEDDFLKTVAVLHDTIEDTDTTYAELKNIFGEKVACYVYTLSRRKDETHKEYVYRIKKGSNDIILIKVTDIIENLSDNPTKSMIKRYNDALEILLGNTSVHTVKQR